MGVLEDARTMAKGRSDHRRRGRQKTMGGTDARPRERLLGPIDGLMLLLPLAIVAKVAHWDDTVVFALAALAIVPVAKWMGRATEQLAIHSGPGIGGLLNASFGNAAELIIALVALSRGPALYPIVRASIIGSILGNLLLVMGLAMLAGGLRYKHQTFSSKAASTSASMMTLAVIGLALPSLLASPIVVGQALPSSVVDAFSLEVAAVLLGIYVLSIIFALVTHTHVYNPLAETEGEESEVAHWSRSKALGVLILATAVLALLAEVMVGAVEGAAERVGMSDVFVGVIVVAIVGNAAEHSTAVLMALRNRMDVAIAIASGSSAQIALFVAPAVVLASLAMGQGVLQLTFEPMALIAVALSVAIANIVTIDAESNWLEGAMLLGVYALMALFFFHHP